MTKPPAMLSSVVILGFARQGKALARFFAERGALVTVSDRRKADVLGAAMVDLEDLPIRYVLGKHPLALLDGCDLLCLSGGVPPDLSIVKAAQERGIPVSNDAQEFLKRCPALVIGITGSAGKTTTTVLVGKMLCASGFTTWVGGNIGNPLINDLPNVQPDHRVVLELSSFQLELMTGADAVSPAVAGVLNITPNHLDRHKTMVAYRAAKSNIVAHQQRDDVAVLGYDEPNARGLASSTAAKIRYFSRNTAHKSGTFLQGDDLILRRAGNDIRVCHTDDIRLRGAHNVLNVLAAIALADAAGASPEAMQSAIGEFTGVEHRLEEVRRWHGALWINDSIATAPERVLAALHSFDEPLVLLAGGRDKDLPWEAFAQRVVMRVRVLITFGEAGPMIADYVAQACLNSAAPILEASMPGDTLTGAVQVAAQHVQAGDVVLLSPGGTSFDAFRDFAERGERFRALVLGL